MKVNHYICGSIFSTNQFITLMKQLFTTYIRRVTIMLLVTLMAPLGLMAQEGSENGSDVTMIYAKMGEMKAVYVNNQIQSIELADPTLAQTVNNGTTFVIYPLHAGETQVAVTALVRKGSLFFYHRGKAKNSSNPAVPTAANGNQEVTKIIPTEI